MRPIQSPARRRALLCALREGHGYTSAAAACGVADRTFREWRADDAAFAEQCREAADFAGDIAEHTLYQRGIKGETLALLAWLRAHKPEKYHRKMLLALDQTERPATTPDTGAWIYPREALRRADPAALIEAVVIETDADAAIEGDADDVTDDAEDQAA